MSRGRFITLEGPEGSGKTTQAKRLVAHLETKGLEVLYTREPGGTALGESIRDLLQHNAAGEPPVDRAEVLLFAASRAQLVDRVIEPALSRGAWVISDRFADSTTVYQGFGREFGVDDMLSINAFAIAEAIPDMTLLLDLPVETSFERIHQRVAEQGGALDRIEQEDRSFHTRVREGYLTLAERFAERFEVLQAGGSIDEVEAMIWNEVEHVLGH